MVQSTIGILMGLQFLIGITQNNYLNLVELMNYIYAASGAFILLFIFLILKKSKKVSADYLLVGINLAIGGFMLSDVLVRWQLSSETLIFQNGVPLIVFPLFVLYVLQFTHAQKKISPSWLGIFAPFLIFLILSITDHYVLQNYPDQQALEAHFNTPTIWYQLIFKGSQLLFIGILIWLLFQLRNFEQKLKDGYSTIETIDVRWLRNFTYIYLGAIASTFVLFLSQNLGLLPFDVQQVFGIVYGILVLSIFYMNYEGIRHYTLAEIDKKSSLHVAEDPSKISHENTAKALTKEEVLIEQQLLDWIDQEQPYLEPKLSLDDVASAMGKSKHQISKIINAKQGRSFYDLINGFRVDHLKKLLNDPKNQHLTILALGLDSGFNSKASLNRIFKNVTGLTPKQYLDKTSQSIAS